MKNILLNFTLLALCGGALAACARNKYDGVFLGTLTAQVNRLASDRSVLDSTADEEKNLIVMLKQQNGEAFVIISNSRLLGDCSLRAKVHQNGTAYIDDPQLCSISMALTGSMNAGGDELILSLRGANEYSNQVFQFRGIKK